MYVQARRVTLLGLRENRQAMRDKPGEQGRQEPPGRRVQRAFADFTRSLASTGHSLESAPGLPPSLHIPRVPPARPLVDLG